MSDFKEKAGNFANKAASMAKDLAVTAVHRTKQVGRIAKLNVDIASQRDAIKRTYAEIGKLYYETKKDAPDEFIRPLFQQVDEAMAAIAAMEAEITQLKTADNDIEADFESVVEAEEVGADIEVEITEEPAETPVEAPVPDPVAETPVEAPVPEPVAETPVEAPVPEPVAETPVEAPVDEPVAETPVEAPVPEPVAEVPVDGEG